MDKIKLIKFKKNSDIRGELIAIDSINNIPFDIKRVFYIKNLDNYPRGFHAHRLCEQILIPVSGSFDVYLKNNDYEGKFHLNKDNEGLYFPTYTWIKMDNFSNNCLVMVLCSYKYDENEYIRNEGDFIKECDYIKNEKTIQNFSLKEQTKKIKMEIMDKISNIIDNTSFVLGKELKLFEENFAKYNNCQYCVGLSNGTAAIKSAIKSLNLENSELIFQANTYVAVPLCANDLNLKFNLIDIDNNLLLDLNKLEHFLETNKSNNIQYILVLVHLYGYCVDMDKLLKLKEKYNFYLIEDAAQAHGSEFKGKKLGTFGDIGCFSFYPSKNLGSFGEGGAILTDNENYYNYIKKYRNYGCIGKYEWEIIGFNERMHNIQAAILDIKLKYLDIWNNNRRKLASIYKSKINNKFVKIPLISDNCVSNYHIFVILSDRRDELKKYLEDNNIKCAIHYPKPFYRTNAYKEYSNFKLELMDCIEDKLLSLPMYPELEVEKVYKVCDIINNFK